MNSLDDILSKREPAPAQEATQEQTTQPPAEKEPAAEAAPEQQPEGQEGEQPAEGGKPPIGAIRQAEREKATKRYTEQVADFDRRLAEQNTAWERRFNTLVEKLGPKPEPQQAPDFYANPEQATLHTVAPHLQRFESTTQYNSRLIAEVRHGDELVNGAEAAFSQAHAAGKIDPVEAQRVLTSPNIYDAAVKWHRRQLAQQEIGDDPVKYREKVEAEIRAKLEAEAQGVQQNGDAQRQNGAVPVMPSNLATARNVGARAGPAWAGPTPLNDIFKR